MLLLRALGELCWPCVFSAAKGSAAPPCSFRLAAMALARSGSVGEVAMQGMLAAVEGLTNARRLLWIGPFGLVALAAFALLTPPPLIFPLDACRKALRWLRCAVYITADQTLASIVSRWHPDAATASKHDDMLRWLARGPIYP